MKRTIVLICGSMMLGLMPPAHGGFGPAPDMFLRVGRTLQKGNPGSYCWSSPRSGTCIDFIGERWPRAKEAPADHRARIRVGNEYRPRGVRMRVHRRVDDEGDPIGHGHGVQHRVTKETRDGRTVYFIRFHVPKSAGHYYLRTRAKFDERGERGIVRYHFHLRLE